MRNFILFRIALLVPVVLVATMVIFAIVQLAP
jgi:ABC-type microcin C transport system permease subunit YejB